MGWASTEGSAHAAEEAVALARAEVVLLQRLVQPLRHLPLLLAEVGRDDHVEDHPLVAAAAGAEPRQAAAADQLFVAGLGPRRQLDLTLALERGNGNRGAEHRLGRRDRDDADQLRAIALEALVLGDLDLDVQIAG